MTPCCYTRMFVGMLVLVLFIGTFTLSPVHAASIKLSIPNPVGNQAFRETVSPDNQSVVYLADHETDSIIELYRVPLVGGTPTKLNPTLDDGRGVFNFAISPDSQSVVYWADQDTDDVFELYRVPLTGGPPTKLNPTLTHGGDVLNFAISPDSQSIVYWADQDTDEARELYLADDGTATVGFATESASIAENGGPANVAVVLDALSLTPVTVDYAVTGGTATNGDDYTLDNGQLTIPPGQTSTVLTIPINEDDQIESDETIEITLSNPTNATLLTDTFTLTIEDTTTDGPDNTAIYLPLLKR